MQQSDGQLLVLFAQAMHIQLIVVVTPDGCIVGAPVYVHHVGQGMIATTSLHYLHYHTLLTLWKSNSRVGNSDNHITRSSLHALQLWLS